MLGKYGITARYNVIKKEAQFNVPGLVCTVDNADNVAMAQIKSLARLNGISVSNIEEAILAVADRNQFNPVADWIKSKPWDGKDRSQEFYDTLTEREDFPKEFKERLMYRWMISAIAALFVPVGFRSRGVLTFQGPQSIGKTSWIAALISDVALRESVVKLDHHMDAGDKDSKIAAATHLIVEIGELESSFQRDVARLKGFITSDFDKIRLPYARSASNFPRRTVFCATVNDGNFLVDSTGNSRWWVIPVVKIDYLHKLEMQQVWAQFAVEFEQGEQWHLTAAEEELLDTLNKDHRVVSVVQERVLPHLDLNRKGEDGLPAMTPTELLMEVGYRTVSNPQAKVCAALLREHLGEAKKINGFYKWRIPLAVKSNAIDI
jgi:putative DNA primase/helicase